MTERIKIALILAAAIIVAAWVHSPKNSYESCVEHLVETAARTAAGAGLLCGSGNIAPK